MNEGPLVWLDKEPKTCPFGRADAAAFFKRGQALRRCSSFFGYVFSMFYPQFREVIVTRITFASSTSETTEILREKEVQIAFHFSFLSTQSVEFGTVVGVTEYHPDLGVGLLTDTQWQLRDFAND